ncbi:MAG: aminomethyl-transferring glycine dehydrogenase [Bacteroidales bacterium]|nr:aminomethyl-transferring glycine dehydrogenase [Bacteroidales bacterium]
MIKNNFFNRHIGPSENQIQFMLNELGLHSLNELLAKTIPDSIRSEKPLPYFEGLNEFELIQKMKEFGAQNKIYKSFIGLGYYGTIMPGVIQRNILENPGWYTSYTPYQAEISQGRLEALLNFQTMVVDLTGLPIANASMLDEATACAEAMIMTYNARSKEKIQNGANVFIISDRLFPQSIEVIKTRAKALGIETRIVDVQNLDLNDKVFGLIVQYPDQYGRIDDFKPLIEKAHQVGALVIMAADILSLTLLTPPGEIGADIAVGSTQRFGIPMGFGGPHAAYFAVKMDLVRLMPGRIIGLSKDRNGRKALRMTLQTREQHIKRERATSNICTAQALLAIMAGMYAVYHGPEGLKKIALDIHGLTTLFNHHIKQLGYEQLNDNFFDTLHIKLPENVSIDKIRAQALENKMNLRYINHDEIGISFDETSTIDDVKILLNIFATANNAPHSSILEINSLNTYDSSKTSLDEKFIRTSPYLTHPIFNTYHSETEMMRYLKYLENKDLALNRTMIPLGSCTMKLNAATELFYLSWPEFGNLHPFVPSDQAQGILKLLEEFEEYLKAITGFEKVTFQPNSGAAGEYTGLLTIKAYHEYHGQGHRNVCLIPASAHGTNPASAAMAGMKVVVIKTDPYGNIDIEDLKLKAEQNSQNLAALMITYPSTHGVFEHHVKEIIDIVHRHGGLVYMDGANLNAQVGYTNPSTIGADICHLNLHKTFAIPHGGGGPGVGPVAANSKLAPFLPGHPFQEKTSDLATTAVSAAPYGNALVIPISYAYVKMMGSEGLNKATAVAILNANYIMKKLEPYYKIVYRGENGFVAHEFILDCREFYKIGITEIDIAKRLMDYGFHAPTVSFPVHGTLMIEPTESEPFSEIQRFIDAMISIRKEIQEIEENKYSKDYNLLKNAPHVLEDFIQHEWIYPYSKEKAAQIPPHGQKYWPSVARIDEAYGDRNLVCTCEPIENYM